METKKHLFHNCSLLILLLILFQTSCNVPSKKSFGDSLLVFKKDISVRDFELNDAKAEWIREEKAKTLKVILGNQGTPSSIKFNFPPTDLSGYVGISMDIKNLGTEPIAIEAQCFNEASDTIDITDGAKFFYRSMIVLNPGEKDSLFITLSRPFSSLPDYINKYFSGMKGLPGGFVQRWENIDLTKITNISVFKQKSNAPYTLTIDNIRAIGRYQLPDSASLTSDFFPFVDQFGQYIHGNWVHKTNSIEDIKEQMAAEQIDLAAHPGPSDWNKYGGWQSGPKLKATGHFRVEKYYDKWWLVDPDGKLFWSQGINIVGFSQSTPVDGREAYFVKTPENGDFYRSNLLLKFGDQWNSEVQENIGSFIHKRMRGWGINTLAANTTPSLYFHKKTPYAIEIRSGISKNMPDTLDDISFRKMLREKLQRKDIIEAANDPWCIGYFVDNELGWPKQNTDELIAKYFRIVSEELKKFAPNKLYLGNRINSRNFYRFAFEQSAKYCDVISINHYDYNLSDFNWTDGLDKPVIVGEFHFGALDRGLFHPGLRSVSNQNQRGRVYKHFIDQALENPYVVGAHWFQYVDQVCTGRRDGENYQIGFVDICDRPYEDMISAVRKISSYMYNYRLKGTAPGVSDY